LSDSKAFLPKHFQWQRLVQYRLDSRNENWQVRGDRNDVRPMSLGAEISMASESISTLANAFILVDRDTLELQSFY
jgi:hypothetical protein